MTRASDLTYLYRAVFTSWTFAWFLQHVWNIDRFEALRWRRVRRFELKSIITILLCIMCPLQAMYDITASKIKYTEGFLFIPYSGDIITKPVEFWNAQDRYLVTTIDYILSVNFSIQTCLLFLLQAFWNYLANNIAKSSFMGSFEFKSYIIYSIFSMALFPLLQWLFRYNDLYTEDIPLLAYGIVLFLIALLGIRSHYRFVNLLKITRRANSSQLSIVLKLEYFKEMNRCLTCGLFIGSISVIILCIDALTSQYLNSHKFTQDLLICHLNFTIWLVFVSLILIFYPSSNTLNDTLAGTKGFTSSITGQYRGNLLEPPGRRWSKCNQNNENSSWSSQGSSRNDRTSWCLDVHDEPSARNNQIKSPRPISFDIPPLPTSVALDTPLPNSPPSIHRPSNSRVTGNSSPFYFDSNALLPSPTYPSSTVITNLPSPIITSENTNNALSLNNSKFSPTDSLKYPSSPLLKLNRNSITSLTSIKNQFTGDISTSFPDNNHHDNSPLISSSSKLTSKKSIDSLNSDQDFEFISRRNSRMSTISNSDKPIIKVTTSTTSFNVSTDLTDDENSDDNVKVQITTTKKKIKKKKPVNFLNNNNVEKKKKIIDDSKTSTRFQQKQKEVLKHKQISLVINEDGNNVNNNGNNNIRTIQQQQNGPENNDNNSQKHSRVPSSPTLSRYSQDSSIVTPYNKVSPRTSSLKNNLTIGPKKIKTQSNLRTDSVEMVRLDSPTSSNSSPKSPLDISPISPSSTSSISPTSTLVMSPPFEISPPPPPLIIKDDSRNISSQSSIVPNSKTETYLIMTKSKPGILKKSKNKNNSESDNNNTTKKSNSLYNSVRNSIGIKRSKNSSNNSIVNDDNKKNKNGIGRIRSTSSSSSNSSSIYSDGNNNNNNNNSKNSGRHRRSIIITNVTV